MKCSWRLTVVMLLSAVAGAACTGGTTSEAPGATISGPGQQPGERLLSVDSTGDWGCCSQEFASPSHGVVTWK